MPIYDHATMETIQLANECLEQHHTNLHSLGVRFHIYMAYAKEDAEGEKSVCLKRFGFPVNSISKILGGKERFCRNVDAEIILDGDVWKNLSREQKLAVLDGAQCFFTESRDVKGEVIYDDGQRPKLKYCLPDHCFRWFDTVAVRHGAASAEVAQATGLFAGDYGQAYFPFAAVLFESNETEVEKNSKKVAEEVHSHQLANKA